MAKPPINQSRGAGAAAPTSAASTAPMAGAFYSPGEEGAVPIEDVVAENQQRAAFRTEFTEEARESSVSLERGGTVDRDVAEHMAKDAIPNPNDLAAEIARIRSIRKPIGAYSQKLALSKRNGYHRHWFNDVAGRVEEAEANGWTHVKDQDGKPICRCVGTGRDRGAMYAYAMEIPEVFWLEDMAARNQAAQDKMESLKKTPFQAKSGQAQASDKGKFYDPTESDSGPLQIVKG